MFKLPKTKANAALKTKAHLLIASQNVKGRGADNVRHSEKWRDLNSHIFLKKIGVLAVQETHLTRAQADVIEDQWKDLTLFVSAHPDNPTGAGGVGLVLNKRLVCTKEAQCWEVVPGRAIVVSFDWHRNSRLAILAVYAPNDAQENRSFWQKIQETLRRKSHIPRPKIVLGDCNSAETQLDRFPPHLNDTDMSVELLELQSYLGVQDGWRGCNPGKTGYTWRCADQSRHSRIDRIFVNRELSAGCRNWRIWNDAFCPGTDHSPVSVELVDLDMPFVGEGRPTMRAAYMEMKPFMKDVVQRGIALEDKLDRLDSEERKPTENIQTLWPAFKSENMIRAKETARDVGRKEMRLLAALAKEKEMVLQKAVDCEIDAEEVPFELQQLDARASDITKRQKKRWRQNARTKAHLLKETNCAWWFNQGRETKNRELIPELRTVSPEGEEVFLQKTDEMAEEARRHHDSLQRRDIHQNRDERERAIRIALDHVTRIPDHVSTEELANLVTEEAVRWALKEAAYGKAAGNDGHIYEFWCKLDEMYLAAQASGQRGFNVVRILTKLFQDVQKHGLVEGSSFSEGWMCPFFKKGDRRDIANYRPITLLNTDYKLFTKALTRGLGELAPKVIHMSQTGFVPGRQITDTTKLARLMISYAEKTERNGVIYSLDQEKAYDKVLHDYLARVLREMGLPELFVSTVETLYSSAHTQVMINGVRSAPFQVTRGVRQGDPLSCLLFDLAIEPLSAMLRSSELEGYNIPGLTENLIATLFADDTTVYLSENDDYKVLAAILNTWCIASGAKFNVGKTECIPIGTAAFRADFHATRRAKPHHEPIPDNVRITADKTAVRILGIFTGNEVDDDEPWLRVLKKVTDQLMRWDNTHPTLEGRRSLIQAFVGGGTQFLTAAQGMPPHILKKFQKLSSDFFWGFQSSHTINDDTTHLPRAQGGMNVLDLETRNDAIYLVWAQRYLAKSEARPTWAFVADEIFKHTVNKVWRKRFANEPEAMFNHFVQDWQPTAAKLPLELKLLVKVTKDHGVKLDGAYISPEIRGQLPIWYHFDRSREKKDKHTSDVISCLRRTHGVFTVDDAARCGHNPHVGARRGKHNPRVNCGCARCRSDRTLGCESPHECQEFALRLVTAIGVKWSPLAPAPDLSGNLSDEAKLADERAFAVHEAVSFDPAPEVPTELEHGFRVFSTTLCIEPEDDSAPKPGVHPLFVSEGEELEITACGIANRENTARARSGYAVYSRRLNIQSSGTNDGPQSKVRAATVAILEAARLAPKDRPLLIRTNSRRAVQRLTTCRAKLEANGWSECIEDANILRLTVATLRARCARTRLIALDPEFDKDRPLSKTIAAARRSAKANAPPAVELTGPRDFDNPGIPLTKITQKLATRHIREAKAAQTEPRRPTVVNLDRTRESIAETRAKKPTDRTIWQSAQRKEFSREARVFLWKSLHEGHKIGEYWIRMKNETYQNRGYCTVCGPDVPETLEHILLECQDPAREQIWRLAKDLWAHKHKKWMPLSYGLILGCGAVTVRDPDTFRKLYGATRLYRILISESAYLIWKIRCIRRIEHADDPDWRPSADFVHSEWYRVLTDRLHTDCLATNKSRYGRKALPKNLVLATWSNVLEREHDLPESTLSNPGFLVGNEKKRKNLQPGQRATRTRLNS